MPLSVAYNSEPELLERLSQNAEVREVYGKLDRDPIGGGRASYMLRPTTKRELGSAVKTAHSHGIRFNYLLNGANLGGIEQTKKGQRQLRSVLDWLSEIGVDAVTVASPYLLRLIKARYPGLSTRASANAVIDSPAKAAQWEQMGADVLCVSGIACNRDFERLAAIRKAVSCDLQLLANACCMPHCSYELTHMQLVTQSSRTGDPLGGFCFDYCFLHCSKERLLDPIHYIRATWIRPEDMNQYEELGYRWFKIVERSCPTELLVRRAQAYADRHFDGNLMELVGPVARVTDRQGADGAQQDRVVRTLLRSDKIKPRAVLAMKRYTDTIIPSSYERGKTPVYIDNRALDGFLSDLRKRRCENTVCERCNLCKNVAERVVEVDRAWRDDALAQAERLEAGLIDSTHWL